MIGIVVLLLLGLIGSVIPVLLGPPLSYLGLLFSPFGILLGAFVGAYIGAKIELNQNEVKIAFGTLFGFIAGTILKLGTSLYISYISLFLC